MAQQVTIWLPDFTGTEDDEFKILTDIAGQARLSNPRFDVAYTVEEVADENTEPFCDQHGGDWGDDVTCTHCTDWDGNPRPLPQD